MPPTVNDIDWVRRPIDRFVLAELEQMKLSPAPPADKRTLLRRATFDLTGLPPAPAEVAAFLADGSPDAFEKLVDRLLASPHYGERWGRHWLDVARYGDSNGLDENLAFANAYRYRDYVITAFNADLPYDQFLREQIAGDLLPRDADPAVNFRRIVATGFLSLGAKMLAEDDPAKMEMDIIDEQVDTLGRAIIGITLGCARCHDHKFDPITTSDYYGLAGIFKSTRTMETFTVVARWLERPLGSKDEVRRVETARQKVAALQTEIAEIVQRESKTAGKKNPEDRFDPKTEEMLARLRRSKSEWERAALRLPEAMAVAEGKPQDVRIHLRGNYLTLGSIVPRRMPRVFARRAEEPIGASTSGRLQLANWLTRPDHPLASRVIVNRVWQGHFGEGLVRSPDNFGRLGDPPTHPALLDWLATEFVRSGWSLKWLHRTILMSATWRQSTAWNSSAAAVDPDNRLLWRMNRRRMDAEDIRDSLLALGGQLDARMGGSLLPTENRTYVTSTANVNPQIYGSHRRTVYLPVVRSAVYDFLQAFDFGDPSVLQGKRDSTTVAPQALFLMNSDLVAKASTSMARRLESSSTDEQERIRHAFVLALGRPASSSEISWALAFVAQYGQSLKGLRLDAAQCASRSWQAFCRALMTTNEFLYLN
jgi:hypothetical protein